MDAVLYVITPLAAASIAGIVTWFVAKRQTSGDIDTSDADALWRASESMRNELRVEADTLRRRAKMAEEKAEAAEKRADRAEKEVYFLHQEVFDLRTRIARLEDHREKETNGQV